MRQGIPSKMFFSSKVDKIDYFRLYAQLVATYIKFYCYEYLKSP